MLFVQLIFACLTILLNFTLAIPQPEVALRTDINIERSPIEGLSNGERISRGLPLKVPVKKFDSSRTEALRPRQSGPPGTYNFYIQVTNSAGTILGRLTFDQQNGVLILPRDANPSANVVFQVRSRPPPLTGVTIRAQNALDGGNYPVVTRDWTDPDENMGGSGHHVVLFAYDPSTNDGDAGDPIGYYRNTRHESSIWNIPSFPGQITMKWFNQDTTTVQPNFYLDRTPRRVLRAATRAEDVRLMLDESDRVYLTAIPV